MAKRRSTDGKQEAILASKTGLLFASWSDPADLLKVSESRGSVVFEAPEVSKIIRGGPPKLPRVRSARGASEVEPPSLGLPFGVRRLEGRLACWSCGGDVSEADVVRSGPGIAACPSCGARLPFA
jgi:hypothetical protein